MNKVFCDVCGNEIKKDNPFENSIFIRVEHETDKYNITDCCDKCLGEFLIKFSKFRNKKVTEKKEKLEEIKND